jgi:hypothetical protein
MELLQTLFILGACAAFTVLVFTIVDSKSSSTGLPTETTRLSLKLTLTSGEVAYADVRIPEITISEEELLSRLKTPHFLGLYGSTTPESKLTHRIFPASISQIEILGSVRP